jgi:hypothetical protein
MKPLSWSHGHAGELYVLSLFLKHLLDLADLFLKFAGYPFIGAFTFQLRIIAQLPGDLLYRTLHFVKRAFCLVLYTGFHGILLYCFQNILHRNSDSQFRRNDDQAYVLIHTYIATNVPSYVQRVSRV